MDSYSVFDTFGSQLTCNDTKLPLLDCVYTWLSSLIPQTRVQQNGQKVVMKRIKGRFLHPGHP